MKTLAFCLLVLLAAVPAVAQTSYPVGTALTLQWDPYTATEITNSAIDHYEVALTGPTPGTASLAISSTTFKLPTLQIGSYAIALQGCKATPTDGTPTVCSSPVTLKFTVDALATVPSPRNPRVEPVPDPGVTLEQAAAMAHAYSTLLRLTPLNDFELTWLATRYQQQSGVPPLTRLNVLRFLNTVALELMP